MGHISSSNIMRKGTRFVKKNKMKNNKSHTNNWKALEKCHNGNI